MHRLQPPYLPWCTHLLLYSFAVVAPREVLAAFEGLGGYGSHRATSLDAVGAVMADAVPHQDTIVQSAAATGASAPQ